MGNIEYTDATDPPYVDGLTFGQKLAAWSRAAGAIASLALVVGIGYWGYTLIIRDVSGVPVVRALQGPMRVQPDNPGGRPADNQGLAVNTVAASGSAAGPAEAVTLAPQPVALADEDATRPELNPTPEPKPEPVVAKAQEADQNSVQALVNQLVAEVETAEEGGEDVQPEQVSALDADAELTPQPAVLTGPGPSSSLRPKTRPAVVERVSATPGAAIEVEEIDGDTLEAGTRLAQLGAFETPELAREEWDLLATRFDDYLAGKSRVIQKAESGGRTFYRLRAMGFEDIHDARRFCSALVAERADCIPVTVR